MADPRASRQPDKPVLVKTPRGTVQVISNVFQATARFSRDFATTIVVGCSEGHFTRSDEEFLDAVFREPYADELELPGGGARLHSISSANWSDVETARRNIAFLASEHASRRIVIFGHQGCGHYARKFIRWSAEEIQAIQIGDLVDVLRDLRGRFPKLEIRAFYKRVGNGRIIFDEVLAD